jgi:RHS repeat-associated protein
MQRIDETGTTTYTYDIDNRLIQIRTPQSTTYNYYYDPFGKRVSKGVNGVRTYFFYCNDGLIGEYDLTGNEIKAYGYAPDSPWTTDPLFQKIGTDHYWYQNDHLGTAQKIINTSGTVVWAATYDSFGKIQIQATEIENNLRFPGQYYDQETGLHYNFFRYYDATIGRYLTKDPIGFSGGDVNLFRYTRNNPINFRDPQGLYDEYVHFYKTYQWALEVGIEPRIALMIAAANQGMDEAFFTMPENPLSWPFGLIFHFQSRSYAQRGLSQCIDLRQIRNFGRFLHILQDSFSHEGIDPITHLLAGDIPDKYSEWNPRDQKMKELTLWWLKEFERTIGRQYHPVIRIR